MRLGILNVVPFKIPNFSQLTKKIAIDLGTANCVVSVLGKGIVLNEPTVVAVSLDDNKVVAVGEQAKEMLGRTPINISASHPLKSGVIADYMVTEAMLRYFISKALGGAFIFKPEVMLAVPVGVTSVEARAVLDAALSAGARNAYLLPEPLAAAIGAKVPIAEASGSMIVNSGGGTTEVALISLGGIVVSHSVRVAGSSLDEAIISHLRHNHGLLVGERTAEEIKITIGSAFDLETPLTLEVKGRDAISGLPKIVEVTSGQVKEAIQRPLKEIVAGIKHVLEETPPELASDVIDRGMVLSGGTSLLRGFDKMLTAETGVPCHVASEPLLCVVKGCAVALENLDFFRKSLTQR